MKIALECPTRLLEEIQSLADFDWVLTHLVLSDPAYARFYARSKRRKVLDNSVNELLTPTSFQDIKEAADIVNPDLIVSPDFLGNCDATLDALDVSREKFGTKTLPVVQGSSTADALTCASEIWKRGFSELAVPYDITGDRNTPPEEMARRREEIVRSLKAMHGFRMHLLGMTTIDELHNYRFVKEVVSVDTGVPILMGMKGLKLGVDRLKDKKEPTLSRMPADGVFLSGCFYNIAYLRKITNHEA